MTLPPFYEGGEKDDSIMDGYGKYRIFAQFTQLINLIFLSKGNFENYETGTMRPTSSVQSPILA